MEKKKIVVIGGGAAGFFGAIMAGRCNPGAEVVLYEKSPRFLTKVEISGGGRCNVTHNCFDPKALVGYYPRGANELIGPFNRFQPRDVIEWFRAEGVQLKVEADGRMFPVTDNSMTIKNCLLRAAESVGVVVHTRLGVNGVEVNADGSFQLSLSNNSVVECDCLLLACGGSSSLGGYGLAKSLGHKIVQPVPSLFTFNIKDTALHELAGVSFKEVVVKVLGTDLQSKGPMLITHWGLSGPAILKLSAWGARKLWDVQYQFKIEVDLLPMKGVKEVEDYLRSQKEKNGTKVVYKDVQYDMPKRFWEKLVYDAGIEGETTWSQLRAEHLQGLCGLLKGAVYAVDGKSTNKDEFVTAGGVELKEVNFKTMESKVCQGLYFAGEVLDIDGITGGFNFQAAWTTGWIAGNAM